MVQIVLVVLLVLVVLVVLVVPVVLVVLVVSVVLVVLVVPMELLVCLDVRFVLLPHHLTVSPLLTKTRILTFTQNHLYRHLWRSK